MTNPGKIQNYIGKGHKDEIETLKNQITESGIDKLKLKNPKMILILSIFLGFLGIDRLYQGGIKMFLCKIAMVCLTFGTWWLTDIYFAKHCAEEDNYNKILVMANDL
ncbi:MAG TPA: TM2 domain-containing protein [Bacillota bacterium]|nr:TM2 domain-containing protein [Bacillota bacterium]HUM55859.1 TM2 domain-containing protein [Bacillota bacterium]